MLAITTIFFIIIPFMSTPLLILGICTSKKYKIVYLVFLAFILGIIAYYWIPDSSMDLYRYHLMLNQMKNTDFDDFIQIYLNQKEIISNLYFYIISQTGNNNFLQFFSTFIGYSIIFYIISDYCKEKKYGNFIFCVSFIYIISTLRYLTFISGIRSTFAIILFGLGIYLEYIKKQKKWICNLIYISTIFIHISNLLILLLKFVYTYIFKEKIDFKKVLIITVIFLVPQILLNIINSFANIPLFQNLNAMYITYFINGSKFDAYTSGNILISNIAKALFCILIYYLYGEKENKTNNFVFLLMIVLLAITVQSKEFIKRFVFLGELFNSLVIMDFYEKANKKLKILIVAITVAFSIILLYLQLKAMIILDYGNLFEEGILKNIFTIFNK